MVTRERTGTEQLLYKQREEKRSFVVGLTRLLQSAGDQSVEIPGTPYNGFGIGHIDYPTVGENDEVYIRDDGYVLRVPIKYASATDYWSYIADFDFHASLLAGLEQAVEQKLLKLKAV